MSAKAQNAENFLSHLDALRTMLIKCFVAVGVVYVPCYILTPHCIDVLVLWVCPPEIGTLKYFAPMEVFVTRLKLALALSIIASFPYCVWQVWKFLLPALREVERKALKWWVLSSYFLFLLGSVFCILVILPIIMRFSASFASEHLAPLIGLGNFLELAGYLSIVFGLMFQFPLAVMLGVRFDLVSLSFLRTKRPYIIVIILIIAGIATPPDVISQILLAVPTWILFELGLFLAARFEKNFESDPMNLRSESEGNETISDKSNTNIVQPTDVDHTMLKFYEDEEKRT